MRLLRTLALVAAVAAILPAGCKRQEIKEAAGAATPSNVRALDDSNFDAEIGTGVVLVDFWATWCGPCKKQSPIVDKVAGKLGGKAKVVKVDIDAAPKTAKRLGIEAIPTLIIFKDGKPEKRWVGLTKGDTLASAVNSVSESK